MRFYDNRRWYETLLFANNPALNNNKIRKEVCVYVCVCVCVCAGNAKCAAMSHGRHGGASNHRQLRIHYSDVIMDVMASQITSVSFV